MSIASILTSKIIRRDAECPTCRVLMESSQYVCVNCGQTRDESVDQLPAPDSHRAARV
jgi:hypothetical protein